VNSGILHSSRTFYNRYWFIAFLLSLIAFSAFFFSRIIGHVKLKQRAFFIRHSKRESNCSYLMKYLQVRLLCVSEFRTPIARSAFSKAGLSVAESPRYRTPFSTLIVFFKLVRALPLSILHGKTSKKAVLHI
jgi:hypothetical protein